MKINNNLLPGSQIRGNNKVVTKQENINKEEVSLGGKRETPDFLKIQQGNLKSSLDKKQELSFSKEILGAVGLMTVSTVAGNMGRILGGPLGVGIATGLMATTAAVVGKKYGYSGLAAGIAAGTTAASGWSQSFGNQGLLAIAIGASGATVALGSITAGLIGGKKD